MRTIMGTTFEFLRIAGGHQMMMRTLDGEDVLVRLYTTEEFMETNRTAIKTSGSKIPPVTRSKAEELVKPFKLLG